MFPAGVVEAIDVLKEGLGYLFARSPCMSPDQFCLEGFEEGFDGCIVVAVASAAHRYLEAYFLQSFLIVMRTILTATVCVVGAALRWVSKFQKRLVEILESESKDRGSVKGSCSLRSSRFNLPFQPLLRLRPCSRMRCFRQASNRSRTPHRFFTFLKRNICSLKENALAF